MRLDLEEWRTPEESDFTISSFDFVSGETITELRLHYRTLGTVRRDKHEKVTNAVLIGHGTGGSGSQFINDHFAGELFESGDLLDPARYFIILPDGIGHGGSSKPSDGLHAQFPRYGYCDMVLATYRLVTEGLGINHLRLVMGTSMGGMHAWLWGEMYPEFMDALMPLASLPVQIAGRNRMTRKMIMDAIRNDPEWKGGDYSTQPEQGLTTALYILTIMGSVPLKWQEEAPTQVAADDFLEKRLAAALLVTDANDLLYQVDASHDYDPSYRLSDIQASLLAINSADDQINPPELGILEAKIKEVKFGRAVVLPISEFTRGHSTHTWANVWKSYLEELLVMSEPSM
ncbi:alpha/beta hydrolase protein [Calycina marina]|uniref:Alpha/beta hydrolase protein n=1 Tax=Calycina marina TaxID=1763456 RepID=A0A9P8CGP1_9HELO|nr:alpha/beta hydrolase protein [Calycina marina]